MRVSLNWLNDYIDLSGLTPEAIAEALTRAGLEVEELIHTGPRFTDDVVVATVLAVNPHPNADKLRLVTVNYGETLQVVCGAPNVTPGLWIAFAKEGAEVFSPKQNAMFKLGQVTIRGIASSGMICSLDELELLQFYPKTEEGIWSLGHLVSPKDLGRPIRDVLQLSNDTVFSIVPTANRGDAMSMLGIAREVSALFGRPVKAPKSPSLPTASSSGPFQVQLHDTALCTAYCGIQLDQVLVAPSPDWLEQRLLAAGIRPINNVVDITNYVMLETGQPLHAFDADRLNPGTITVTLADPQQTFVTLDGEARCLQADTLMITCEEKAIALAGVMGGADSAVNAATTKLFLEAAVFPWATIRRSSRSLALRTEASARYERGIDPIGYQAAAERAVQLLSELAGARVQQVCCAVIADNSFPIIKLRQSRLEKILGLVIEPERVSSILFSLGFEVTYHPDEQTFSVQVPSYRMNDVSREIDLIEEVIRIVGLDDLPNLLPQASQIQPTSNITQELEWSQREQLRQQMVSLGFQEIITTSLIGENLLNQTGILDIPEKRVNVTNSHSPDHHFLRQSLLPNLLSVALDNLNMGQTTLQLFELGRVYERNKGKPTERFTGVQEQWWLVGLLTGQQEHWQTARSFDYFSLLGYLQAFITGLGLHDRHALHLEADSQALLPWHSGRTALAKLGNTTLGRVGELHPRLRDEMKLRQDVWIFEWLLEPLLTAMATVKPFFSRSLFPAVQRDLAFVAPDIISHQVIVDTITAQQPVDDILQTVSLFDEYRSDTVGQGLRSLAYRFTLQAHDHTLTDAEISTRIQQIREQLQQTFSVQFRS